MPIVGISLTSAFCLLSVQQRVIFVLQRYELSDFTSVPLPIFGRGVRFVGSLPDTEEQFAAFAVHFQRG